MRSAWQHIRKHNFQGQLTNVFVAQSKQKSMYMKPVICFLGATMLAVNSYNYECDAITGDNGVSYDRDQIITNWSSTHGCRPGKLYEPKNAQEVCRALRTAHDNHEHIRPIGTALSPNGIAMSADNLISLSAIDYIEVDVHRQTVTVGAGARVSEMLKELSKHGLTLENFSSIQEQQVGGWTQVAAHGTGCTLSTVDDMIVRMKLATPMEGLLTLSNTSNARLFSVAKVGLGSLGVVTELTLKCVPKFNLKETTTSIDLDKISDGHNARLKEYRHVRYMWLPYTSKVISVVSNPTNDTVTAADSTPSTATSPTKPLYELLMSIQPSFDRTKAESMSFSQLRDLLLDHAPLDTAHIKRVNLAESQFWDATAKSSVDRVDDSTNILGFDCGGEQLVYEVCFPIGSLEGVGSGKDLAFVKKLIKVIESKQLPAPCPIEQRWSASSTSPMSPAYAPAAASPEQQEVFSWVGVIMYLPPGQTDAQRAEIKKRFTEYTDAMQPLLEEYNAHAHWAKIELPERDTLEFLRHSANHKSESKSWMSSMFGGGDAPQKPLSYDEKMIIMKRRIADRYDVTEFNNYRKVLDPRGVLSNEMMDELFGSVKTK